MGVTNRNKITVKASVASSTAGSSLESLHLSSENDDYAGEPVQNVSFRRALNLITHNNVSRAIQVGRRRANRLKSLRDLENLGTISEEDEDDSVPIYASNRNSPFMQILNDGHLSKIWEHFCSCSEIEQSIILQCSQENYDNDKKIVNVQTKNKTWYKYENGRTIRLAVDAYKSLPYPTRRKLRTVKNLQPLTSMEQVILDNFHVHRKNILENMKLDINMHFICCTACQYYNLNFKVLDPHCEDGSSTCTIDGEKECYVHCAETLSTFLQTRRKSQISTKDS